jgi:SPP1 family phage portal protein
MFGVVPVVMCTTDEAHRPAFYSVLGLIDAYNRLVSEGVFQFEAFAQAYLVLTNYLMTTDELKKVDSEDGRKEALEKIRKMRVMMMDEAGDAKFIKREVQTEAFLAIRDTLEENINRFSRNINYSDPEVLGKATNLTVNTRTKPIDNSANDFADIIEMAVIEMFRIANNVTSKLGMPIDADLLNVVFNYDKPANVPEEAQSVATVVNAGATLEDALSMLSACENPKEWAARAEEQRTALAEEYKITPEAADDSPE